MARLPTPRLPRLGGIAERIRSRARRLRYALGDATYAVTSRVRRGGRRVRDALVPDRLAAGAGRFGASIRSAGRAVRDLGGLIAGGMRSGLRDLREAWLRLSLRTRQVIGAIVAVGAVVAGLWLLLVPALPCQFPGGDACPPSDDAAELVPADALAYLHSNLSPDSAQYEAVSAFARQVPLLSAQLSRLAPLPGGGDVDFTSQIEPWLGGEVALAVVAAEGGTPAQVYLLEVGDADGAAKFSQELLGSKVSTKKRGGIEISVNDRGVATATVGGFLVIGTEVAVERVVDTHSNSGRSLADSDVAGAIDDALPDDSLVQAYLSEDGAQRLLAGNRGPLSQLDTFVNFGATVGAGAALVAAPDGLEVDIHSVLDPERAKTEPGFFDAFPPFEPKITGDLPPRTLAYLGLGNPEASIQSLLEQAQSQAPGLVVGFEDFAKRLQKAGGVSVQTDLLPVLGGEAAFSIQPPATVPAAATPGASGSGKQEGESGGKPKGAGSGSNATTAVPGLPEPAPGAPPPEAVAPPPGSQTVPGVTQPAGPPYLTFIATGVDPAAANEALAKLQAPLSTALVPQAGQTPTFDQSTINGITVHSIQISPVVDLTYAIFDGKLVVSTQPEGVARAVGGPGGLSGSALYDRATEGFPDHPALLLYLNLRELLALAEGAGLADVSAYLPFADEARKLAAAALSVERGDRTLDTKATLVLAQPAG